MTVRPLPMQISPATLSLRACAAGAAVPLCLLGIGLLAGWLPLAIRGWIGLGVGVALLAGTLGITLQCYQATLPPRDARAGPRYLLGIVAGFGLLVLFCFGGMLALFMAGVKFPGLAAFGLSFATAASIFQTLGSLVIGGALRARSRDFTAMRHGSGPHQAVPRESACR